MNKPLPPTWIRPDWPAPATVQAISSSRHGGVSDAPWASLNLGNHVDDHPQAVEQNRAIVRHYLPADPLWLTQVHGVHVVNAATAAQNTEADASVAHVTSAVCAIMTADCLPVLLCNQAGTVVGAAHAGWRGLCNGVIEATIAKMDVPPATLIAWLGPAIGPNAFEVGDEVKAAFTAHDPTASAAFQATATSGKWLVDIYLLAKQRLNAQGVTAIYGGNFCTVTDAERFFSYRRDQRTGRMASLIWLSEA
ncbi:peptidoglycan editing factor PgeF [Iodobacter sp. CM08]|uniref:peptidoglycan editing factor PgeF n=1 Tax=Iodobacter sp. CM08 TaxID=3085902 RepID=UPI002980D34A|nr:peptidoglycan editing factor PgeF [Iodobacter sp. CM08]MDW5416016.1 peptidoglycan editing factor PgeF [Iodobacter sp. CM08]